MLIPVLAWGALRSGAYEAIAQLFVVLGIGDRAHHPRPRARSPRSSPAYGLAPDVQGILLSIFIVDCALIVVPFVLSVGEQVENARQVAAERDRVANIVDGASGVAIIGTDEQARVTLFNPGAERLLGYAAEEMTGRQTRFLHSADAIAREGPRARCRQRLRRGRGRDHGPRADEHALHAQGR